MNHAARIFTSILILLCFLTVRADTPPIVYQFSPPMVKSGNRIVSIPVATTSVDGYLSATDWNTFNNKQGAISGTANSFAGYDGSGLISDIPTWIHNSSGGAEETLSVTPTDVGSTLSIPYNASALNISPTNNLANTYLWQNLDQINLNGTNDYLGVTGRELFVTQAGNNNLNGDLITFYPRIQLGVGGSGASSTTRDIFATIRESGTHTANTVNVIDAQFNQDGGATVNQAVSYNGSTYIGGTANFAYGINQAVQVDGTLNDNLYGANIQTNTNSAVSVADANILSLQHFGPINGSISGININEQGNIGGNANDLSSYRQGTVTGGYNSLSMARDGLNLNGANGLNINFNSNSATTGDYRAIIAGNDGTISQNGAGSLIFQNGTVSKSWTGYGMYLNADAGDGTSNIIGSDISIQNHTIAGQIFGFNLNNNSNVTGNNNITGLNVNNQGTGYRFAGAQIYNNKNMTEEIRGFQFNNDNANARTGTGLDINMSGAFLDDVQGLRVNMGTTTSSSTTNHVKSAEFSGGTFGVQSEYTPFNAANVEVGNNITMTASILNGSPLTGTDTLVQLFQSNLLVHDDIATGPFGLDTNMVAMSSQIAVDSGKTVPLVRSLLLGTTVPQGSGGFITDHVVLELLGLPSFGGSVTNTNRYGIRDSQLVGQNFCDGVGNECYFMDVRDPNALVRIAGDVFSNSIEVSGGSVASGAGSDLSLSSSGGQAVTLNGDSGVTITSGQGAPVTIASGSTSGATSGAMTNATGDSDQDTGDYTFKTGNTTLSFTSGSLFFKTGTAGTPGNINFQPAPGGVNNFSATMDLQSNLIRNVLDLRLDFTGHLSETSDGSISGVTNSGAGTGASVSVGGNDLSGLITITTGSASLSTGAQVTVTPGRTFGGNPLHVILTPHNARAGSNIVGYYVTSTGSDFTINFSTAGVASQTYEYEFLITGEQ